MVTYADSSFLVSVYVADANTAACNKFFSINHEPLVLTGLSRSETRHAIRMLAFRRGIPHEVMARGLLTFERDEHEGFYQASAVALDEIVRRVDELGHRHALDSGLRYLDLLHIASALLANAKRFITFDLRQRKLAKALGLEVKL